jgi:hypothetical protein
MNDLEKSIASWRRQMAADGVKSVEVLDELETHLREEIARQTSAGQDTQKSFDAAVARIGKATELSGQFATALERRHWWQVNLTGSSKFERKMAEFLMLGSGLFVTGGMSFCILFKRGSCAELSPSQQAAALTAALLIGLLWPSENICIRSCRFWQPPARESPSFSQACFSSSLSFAFSFGSSFRDQPSQ